MTCSFPSLFHDRRWSLGLLVAAIPAVVFIIVLARTAINIPDYDDYCSLLPFLSGWKETSSLSAHFHLLVDQFNSHRIIVTKCVALLGCFITGRINLIFLQVLSWLGWLILVFGLAAITPVLRRDPIKALPLTLLLMHPENASTLLMAIGMGNVWALTFSFLALAAMLAEQRAIFCLAPVFAIAAAASFANGLLVFPVAALGLVAHRKFARAGVFSIVGGLVWILYFTDYSSDLAPLNLAGLAQRAIIMAGGMFVLLRLPEWMAMAGGGALFLLLAWLIGWLWISRRRPVHVWFAVFLVMTTLMAARGRVGWPPYYMLQDRYRLYGLLMLAVCYLAAAELFSHRHRLFLLSGSALALGYCFTAYVNGTAPMLITRQWGRATAMNWQLGQCFPRTIPADWPSAFESLRRADRTGIYELPRIFTDSELAAIRAAQSTPVNAGQKLRLEPSGASCGQIGFPDMNSEAGTSAPPLFALLTVDGRDFVLPVVHLREHLAKVIPHFSLLNPEPGLLLPDAVCFKGRHEVRCFARQPAGTALQICWSGWLVCP